MEEYLNAAISGDTENLPNPISRIDFLLCELIKTLGESGASIEEVEKIVTDKVAEIVADAPKDFDTLKELSDWIYTHEESAAAMNTDIQSKVDKEEGKSLISDTEIARLANVENYDDSQMKEYVDSKIAFYDGIVSRSTNTDTTNCWVKIAECEAPNSTAQIMDEITLYPKTTDSAVKTTCKVRVEGKGAYANTWKLHIIDSTKDFNSDKVKLIYDKNIVDDKRKIELWGYNINGWDGFYSQKTFGNNYTLTYGLKCLTSQNKFATTYLHDDFAEAPTIDISIKSLVNEGLASLENDIALNRTTLGYQRKNLLKNTAVTKTVNGVIFTVNDDKSITVSGKNTSSSTIFYTVCQTGELSLEIGKTYIMTGCPANNKDDNGKTLCYLRADKTGGLIASDYGNGVTFSTSETSNPTYALIWVGGNADFTDKPVTFKPMLRYADITDDTYEPYKESVDKRLINNTSDIAINRTTLGYQHKNLLKPTSSKTRAGITYTVNQNGSVTLTGTSTTGSSYNYFSIPVTLQPGKYKVNGMPSTSSNSTYRVDLRANESGGTAYGYGAKEFEVEFTETTTAYYMIRIDGSYKESLNGVTFYPMVRYADIVDDTYEPYSDSVDERILENKSDIVINKTTLGYQRKNLFNETEYLSSIASVSIGTFNISGNSITLTATGKDCYTKPHASGDGGYRIPVTPDTDYILSWESDNSNDGYVYAFMNGSLSQQKLANNKDTKYFKFTTNSNTTFITIRLGVSNSGESITYSNIMLRYADILDNTYEPYQPSVQEQIIGAFFPMTIQKGLADYTDLNTITEIGNYVCHSGGSAVTMINCPTKAGGFRLIVTNVLESSNSNTTVRYQWIIPNNLNDVLCFRRRIDLSLNTFSSWYSFGGTVVS